MHEPPPRRALLGAGLTGAGLALAACAPCSGNTVSASEAVLADHVSAALRQAQLEMLNSGAAPYYWAGFVLAGNPRGSLFPAPAINLTSRSSR